MKPIIPDIEKSSLNQQKAYQESLLQKQLTYILSKSKFYQDLFQINKIDFNKIKKIEDLKFIPATSKSDLQTRNKDFFCIGNDEVSDYVTTSGTSGEPVLIPLSNNDLQRLAYNEFLSLSCAGISYSDTVQIMTTIDRRFMAGLAYYIGLREIGASIVRAGAGTPGFQWETIQLVNPTAAITVPSFILKLIKFAEDNAIDFKKTNIKRIICIGDSIRNSDFSLNSLGIRISNAWDVPLFSTYASSEMSSAFTECSRHIGGHHHPELIITEFLNEDNNPVSEGELGELTITNLGVDGFPLLRFKTGDICSYHTEPCDCGRTTIRLGPVVGRKNQMIKALGTTVYPPALYDILDSFSSISNYIISVKKDDLGLDEITVRIGTSDKSLIDINAVRQHFRTKLRLVPLIIIQSPTEINTLLSSYSGAKENRFLDQR